MFKRFSGALAPLLMTAPLLGACATIVEGTDQSVAVVTNPVGATCTFLREGKTVAQISPTPGQFAIDKDKHAINMHCELAGYQPVDYAIESSFTGSTAGNILVGGLIGLAVDAASGANNEYPQSVTVNFTPLGQPKPTTSAVTTDKDAKKAKTAKPTS